MKRVRKFGISAYPVGARWIATDIDGWIGHVWLEKREKRFEMWQWSCFHPDGGYHGSDWTTTRRGAVQECPLKGKVRFRRVKAT